MYHGERLNSITHLVGTALAIVGATMLIARVVGQDDPWKIAGVVLFGLGLVTLYSASTLYHAIRGPLKSLLRRADHAAVFLLIAGTYAPFALGPLRGGLGLTLFAVVWAMAVLGIWQAMRRSADLDPSPVPHLVMGWLGAAALIPLSEALGLVGMAWLAAGGLLYTIGVLFYVKDRVWRHAHGIWHLFVMGGSASHFVAVMFFVA
jgi:hemolysin III